MAIVLIQTVTTPVSSSSSVPITIASTGAGNLIVISTAMNPGGVLTITSIVDNMGNSYVEPVGILQNGLGGITDLFYSEGSISGVTSITVNFSAVTTGIVYVQEYSGVAFSGALGAFGGVTQNSSATEAARTVDLFITQSGSVVVDVTGNLFDIITAVATSGTASGTWVLDHADSAGSAFTAMAHFFNGSAPVNDTEGTFSHPPVLTNRFVSCTVEFLPATGSFLSLSLSDSISSNEALTKEYETTLTDSVSLSDTIGVGRAQSVSDSMTVTDSFSLQSSAVVVVHTPAVETLVNQLVPAEVKTFFEIE